MIQTTCIAMSATLAAIHNLASAMAERNLLNACSAAGLRPGVTMCSWSHTNAPPVKGAKMFPQS